MYGTVNVGDADELNYGVCSTSASTTAKTVSIKDFILESGKTVQVKFSYTNTAKNPTLNVSGSGAKAIYYNNAAVPANYLMANHVYTFSYDGSHWILVDGANAAAVEDMEQRLKTVETKLLTDEYGMRWVKGSSTPTVERCLKQNDVLTVGSATGLTFSVNSDGSFKSSYSELPIWGEMERVTINGQVMVRVPKYYIKREEKDGYQYTWVCKQKKAGYRCAGIFLRGASENDFYYIGAYECSNGTLGKSQSGQKYDSAEKNYTTGWTMKEYRDAAKEIGSGWGITTIAEVCDFWQVLLPIEFGTRDTQSMAAGVCGLIDGPFDDNYSQLRYRTGMTDSVKNLHGIYHLTDQSPDGDSYNYNHQTGINCGANPFVWHGIENPYGCLMKYVDGLTIYNGKWYTANNREVFATESVEGYTPLNYTPPGGTIGSGDGFVKELGSFDNAPYCQLPTEFTDTEYTYFSDEFYYNTSKTGYYYAAFGGSCDYAYYAGAWCVYVYYTPTYRFSSVGSRLSYTPV